MASHRIYGFIHSEHRGFQAVCVLIPSLHLRLVALYLSVPDVLVFSGFFSGLHFQCRSHQTHPTGALTQIPHLLPRQSCTVSCRLVFHPRHDKELRPEREPAPRGACRLVQLTHFCSTMYFEGGGHWVTCWLKHLVSLHTSNEKCNYILSDIGLGHSRPHPHLVHVCAYTHSPHMHIHTCTHVIPPGTSAFKWERQNLKNFRRQKAKYHYAF